MSLRQFIAACLLASPFIVFASPFVLSAIASSGKGDSNVNTTPDDSLLSTNQRPGRRFNHVCNQAVPGKFRCHSLVAVKDDLATPMTSSTPSGYGPDQFHRAYRLPKNAATPTTIAIVDAYDSPTIENDLKVYNQTYKLPECTTANGCFKKVNQNGQQSSYPSTNASWALEIALDVETAHAICQNCKILLVEANSNSWSDLLAAEDTAVKLGATVISNSWGGSEFASETTYDSHLNHPGVAIIFSSGDNGYGVEYPAASPYVTAVGGTKLVLSPDNTRNSEVAWSGAGSGCSAYEPKPSWQKDTKCTKRTVADISAVADPSTGAAVYNTTGTSKGWLVVGGTSLSAPIIAGIYAIAGNSISTLYGSYPYYHTSGFFDVLSGSTSTSCSSYLCSASAGYDGPTGLGSPRGNRSY